MSFQVTPPSVVLNNTWSFAAHPVVEVSSLNLPGITPTLDCAEGGKERDGFVEGLGGGLPGRCRGNCITSPCAGRLTTESPTNETRTNRTRQSLIAKPPLNETYSLRPLRATMG